ncbi:MAG: DUF211 domain-containing protein [Gammaproteobacteria bacterium]|jgi:hypothetical protein
MNRVKKIVLDVLKPHQPNSLRFAQSVASVGSEYRVSLTVVEVDENTETLQMTITAPSIDFEAIEAAVREMGASIHSIDEVEVINEEVPGDTE